MDEDAIESGNVENPRKVAIAEGFVIWLLSELGRLDIHRHLVCADRDSRLPVDLDAADVGQGHLLAESSVIILDGVAHPFSIDIEFADGVLLAIEDSS